MTKSFGSSGISSRSSESLCNFEVAVSERRSPNPNQFWFHSIVEMGEIDLPTTIDYVLDKTKQSTLYYISHSVGTTMGLIALSKKPEYNVKIKEAIMMAPIWHCTKYQFMMNKESSAYQMALQTWVCLIIIF